MRIGPFGLAVVTAWGVFASVTAYEVCHEIGQPSIMQAMLAFVVAPFFRAARLAVTEPGTGVLAAGGVIVLWVVFMAARDARGRDVDAA